MNPENRKEIPLWSSRAPLAIENDTDHLPTITPYYPSAWKFNCKAVVILPGGAYAHLADHEGRGYAEYLASRGYCCFVVKYRLGSNGYHHPAELADAARGIRFVRALAPELGIRPDGIGVMGSSAGGHLAALLGNCYSEALYEEVPLAETRVIPGAEAPDFGNFRYFTENNRFAAWDLMCAIEEDRPPIANASNARTALEMINAVYASQLAGRIVRFPLADRNHPLEQKEMN